MARKSGNKTRPNDADVSAYINHVEDDQRRADAQTLLEIFQRITGQPAKMWGDSIVGFGEYDYQYSSGRSGTWMQTGFAPRKQNMSIYIMNGFITYEDLRARLGKHKVGKACLYIKRLSDVNLDVLEEMIDASFQRMQEKYGC